VSDDVIRLKKRVFEEVNVALKKNGKTLESFFMRADLDGNNEITIDEFRTLFKNMKITLIEAELQ
jgi:EF hand